MKKKQRLKCIEIVREAVHRIDPYGLLEGGSAEYEFDSEINAIVSQLPRCRSGRDVSHAIARVLNSSFSQKHKPEEFEVEAGKIFDAAELIET